jgi:hypothetical protein
MKGKTKLHKCKCGENNPAEFYGNHKSKCKACSIKAGVIYKKRKAGEITKESVSKDITKCLKEKYGGSKP